MAIKKKKETKEKKKVLIQQEKQEEESLLPEINLKPILDKIKVKIVTNKSLIALIIIIVVILGLVVAGLIYRENSAKFTYNYIPFEKNYFGSILLYTARFNFVDSTGNVLKNMEIDFRNDPRKLENINVDIASLKLVTETKTYVVDDNIQSGCEDAGIAFINLARFLSNIGLDVKGAVSNQTKAIETNVTLANCEIYPQNTVIMIKNGEENSVRQTSKSCYEITFKDCDILKTTEKFEVFVLGKILEQIPISK